MSDDCDKDGNYDYLLDIPISALTEEKLERLNKEAEKAQEKFDRFDKSTIENLWKDDLQKFLKAYRNDKKKFDDLINEERPNLRPVKKIKKRNGVLLFAEKNKKLKLNGVKKELLKK